MLTLIWSMLLALKIRTRHRQHTKNGRIDNNTDDE